MPRDNNEIRLEDVIDAAIFRDLVSGQRRGAGAVLARAALRVLEASYTALVRHRNRRYDAGRATVSRAAVPVVSVGNLTLGGTGKTPLIEWLARWFCDRGLRAGIASRGYKSGKSGVNDEALELAQKLPNVPHRQHADRARAARQLCEQDGSQVVLLDDGFQHRRLHRDLDIVLLDATEPFGYGHVFPRGLLREPLESLRRADFVILSRCDTVDAARRAEIEATVRRYAPHVGWAEARHEPISLVGSDGRRESLQWLRDRRILACCGLGNPAGFRHTLTSCGVELVDFINFPDHYPYTAADVGRLAEKLQRQRAEALVTTHKDLVKLDRAELKDCPVWAVRIEIAFLSGQPAIEERLEIIAKNSRRAQSSPRSPLGRG